MKILFLYYTQDLNHPLTVNINLIWAGGTTGLRVIRGNVSKVVYKLIAYDKAITLFM